MKKTASLILPALLFFAVESAFALVYSDKTLLYFALSLGLWGAVAFGSAVFLRSRPGRAVSIVLPAALFGIVVLIKILPGRINSVSNLVSLGAAVSLFGLAALIAHRVRPDRGPRFAGFVPAAIFALTSNIVSFMILPDLPADRIGLQILVLLLAGLVWPLVLIGIGARAARPFRAARAGALGLPGALALALILVGAAGLSPGPGPETANPPGPPNVVLIVMDTARRAELSVYDASVSTTPRLAELARDSVVFDRAYANANWTIPSHACLLTGFLSSVTRTNFQDAERGDIAPLSPEFETAAAILRGAGYRTASFPSNSYNLNRRFGFDQGFERLWSGTPRDANLTAALLAHKLVRAPRAADWLARHLPIDEYISAGALNRKILRWIDGRGRDPFFLFVNYTEPHGFNALPREIKRKFGVSEPPPLWRRNPQTGIPILDEGSRTALRRWYDAELGAMDAEIGRLLDRLKADGFYDNTLVAVTADHGELLGEHGDFGHVIWLYEPTIHVPLLVKYPGGGGAGTRSDRLVSHVDMFAEILSRAGRPLPDNIQGRPFAAAAHPVISQNRPTPAFARPWPARYGFRQTAILSCAADGVKMIRSDTGREEIYDLRTDPGELRDLPDPALRTAVGGELDAELDRLEKIARLYGERFKKVKFDSLGYVK